MSFLHICYSWYCALFKKFRLSSNGWVFAENELSECDAPQKYTFCPQKYFFCSLWNRPLGRTSPNDTYTWQFVSRHPCALSTRNTCTTPGLRVSLQIWSATISARIATNKALFLLVQHHYRMSASLQAVEDDSSDVDVLLSDEGVDESMEDEKPLKKALRKAADADCWPAVSILLFSFSNISQQK